MSADGTRVAVGRLRVDAARAVGKLREYQLPDPSAWVLEVVRAAVAFGATRVRVSGDADDVRVAWDGGTLESDALAELFDELVDPAPRPERRPLRLLATGVNTALGLEPRWVDVVVTGGDGAASRARYTPELLEESDGEALGLRSLEVDTLLPPRGAPARGGLVHLRRLPLLDAIPLMVGYGEPRELSVVRQTCEDPRIPIEVGRTELGSERSHADLIRVSLGQGLAGFLALVDPSVAADSARLEVAELGVILARYSFSIDSLAEPRAQVPLRLYVDADRMPTNASRSGVRLDDAPVADAIERGRELVPEIVRRLARELGDAPSREWPPWRRERLRAAALQLLASFCAGEQWMAQVLGRPGHLGVPSALDPLLGLPLLRDALGRVRAPKSFRFSRRDQVVHFGAEPMGEELEPWLGETLWVPPGDSSSVLLGGWVPEKASSLERLARGYQVRQRTFSRQKKRRPKLEEERSQLLAVPLRAPGKSLRSCVPKDLFEIAGLEGEVALHHGSQGRARAVSLLLDGREIEVWRPRLPLCISGVASSDELMPAADYRGVERDAAAVALFAAVRGAAVVASEALASRWMGRAKSGDRATVRAKWIEDPTDAQAASIVSILREAVELAHRLFMERSRASEPRVARAEWATRRLLESKSPLLDAPIWPRVGGGASTTRELLRQGIQGSKTVGYYLGRVSGGPAPGGLPVYDLDRGGFESLTEWLPRATFVDYRPVLARPLRAAEPGELARSMTPSLGAAIEVTGEGYRAALAWGTESSSTLEIRHWGRRLVRRDLPGVAIPCTLVVDDARVVPTAAFDGLAGEEPTYPVALWSRRLARAFADALAGGEVPGLHLGPLDPLDASSAREALFASIIDAPDKSWLGKKRLERLRKIPLVRCLRLPGHHTLAAVAEDFPEGSIPWVPETTIAGANLDGWHPVAAAETDIEAYAMIAGRTFESGLETFEAIRRAARRKSALAAHRLQPEVDPARWWPGRVVPISGRGFEGAATLSTNDSAQVEVLIESRAFQTLTWREALPVRICIDLPTDAASVDFDTLGAAGMRRARYAVLAGARALLSSLAKDAPESLTRTPEALRLLARFVEHAREKPTATNRKILEKVASAPAFPSIRGEHVSLYDAAPRGQTLRVASWDEPWLEPMEGERASSYDRPVLRLLPSETYREILRGLWQNRATRDVTGAIARLQAKRRVARGLVEAPRLASVEDSRFRFPLSDLLDEEGLEVLGFGEVALAPGETSRVSFFDRGVQTRVLEFALFPAVHVAAHSPLVRRGAAVSRSVRERVEAATRDLVAEVIRAVVDGTPPDQLPGWVRRELRQSALAGGALHLERLMDTPIFETTTDEWVSPARLLAQVERFGEAWTTPVRERFEPMDAERVAIRLPRKDRVALGEWVEAVDATDELRADETMRVNIARPRVESLAPTAEERAAAAAVIDFGSDEDGARGTVTLLKPGFDEARGLHLSRARRPLGRIDDPHRWPTVCRIDEPQLEPDRTWSGPKEDEVLAGLRNRLRASVDTRLHELIPFPFGKVVSLRARSSFLEGLKFRPTTALEAVVWLEDEWESGRLTVLDPYGERTIDVGLPIHGTLWITARPRTVVFAALRRRLYEKLLARVVARLASGTAARPGPAVVHVLNALERGVAISDDLLAKVPLECFAAEQSIRDLHEHIQRGGRVALAEPADRELALEAGLAVPILIEEGPIAASLRDYLGDRARSWRSFSPVEIPAAAPPVETSVDEEAPTPPRVAPPARALEKRDALADALLERWNALSVPPATAVAVDRRRKRPFVRWDASAIIFAGQHSAVRAARAAVEAGAPEAPALVALLLASAAGARRRDHRMARSAEAAVLGELMRD